MTEELVLADMVRTWAAGVLEDPAMTDRAVRVAESAYAGGASIGEACAQARLFVGSWVAHPSHRAAIRRMRERLAS